MIKCERPSPEVFIAESIRRLYPQEAEREILCLGPIQVSSEIRIVTLAIPENIRRRKFAYPPPAEAVARAVQFERDVVWISSREFGMAYKIPIFLALRARPQILFAYDPMTKSPAIGT